jgi:hypothetical protein
MNKFIEERWYMHLIGGAITVTPIIGLLIKFDPSFDIGKIAQVFIAGFFAYCIGFMWEYYFAAFHEAPFDYNDIWFTVLGALIGTSLL